MGHDMSSEPMQEIPASACSHCTSPDGVTISSSFLDQAPVVVLIAYMATKATASTFESPALLFIEKAQAPPNSSSTLYTTTQRIRV